MKMVSSTLEEPPGVVLQFYYPLSQSNVMHWTPLHNEITQNFKNELNAPIFQLYAQLTFLNSGQQHWPLL